jgi:transposase-like protein
MIDCPMTDLLDDDICTSWLERHFHPAGLHCPHCGSSDRRRFRAQRHFPAYRGRVCAGSYTLLTGTIKSSNTLNNISLAGQGSQ